MTRPCTHKSRLVSSGWSLSALPLKADMLSVSIDVRLVPRTDIDTSQIPLRFDLHQPLTTANETSSLER